MADGGFDVAPPPVSGLGNFKGVMLCNRPSDNDAASRLQGGSGGDAPAFKSTVAFSHNEQLGLNPCRSYEPTVKTRGPSAALRRHVRWLKELQTQMKDERDQNELEEKEGEEKRQKMKASFQKSREAVREMMKDREKVEKLASKVMGDKTQKKAAKPLWAMTEKEKEDFEEENADELINFAENLDYDQYVGDLEFRHALEAMKDRTGKLKKEQDAFKEALVRDFNAKVEADDDERSTAAGTPRGPGDGIDGQSVFGGSEGSCASSRRSRASNRSRRDGLDWDSSTVCGDERPLVDQAVKDEAAVVLESAPQMRAIHSKESVQRIIEKTKAKQATLESVPEGGSLAETIQREGKIRPPVIHTSEDTQARLNKPLDPSMLPYLYRSPAI